MSICTFRLAPEVLTIAILATRLACLFDQVAHSMKKFFVVAVTALVTSHAAFLDATPMAKVVKLLKNMQTKIQQTGKKEQSSYDKYSCWCEETCVRRVR